MGLPFIDPYLQSVTSNFAHGANFATAGATVRSVTYLSPFNLGVQVKQWQQFYSNVVNTLANDPGERPIMILLQMKSSKQRRSSPLR